MNDQRRFHQNQNGKAVEICPGDEGICRKCGNKNYEGDPAAH
jgi:hypothetical protein